MYKQRKQHSNHAMQAKQTPQWSPRANKARQRGLTDALEAIEEGPAKDGIQNQPSVSRPSSATFDSALQQQEALR